VPGHAALLAHDARDEPQIYAGAIHFVPHADGTTAVGSADTAEALEALIADVRRLVPALASAPVIERWSGLRPRARTRAPMLGPWPGRAGHIVANGGFRIGLGLAPAVAATIADLMLDGEDRIPEGFRPEDSLARRS
jgi:glycine oxidase